MNKRQKGLEFQRWIKKWLEEKEWKVHNQTGTLSIIKKGKQIIPVPRSNDIFNCIDLIGKKPNQETLWIQATLDAGLGRKINKIKEIPFDDVYDDVQVWIKRADKSIDIFMWLTTKEQSFLLGKIIRRKFYVSEGMKYEY